MASPTVLESGRRAATGRWSQTQFEGRDERLAKYERHLHNLLPSTLHKLERLQARREGQTVPPPAVADLNVTLNTEPS